MAAVEVDSECLKHRSSARISSVNSYEKLNEFSDMEEVSPKTTLSTKRVKRSKKRGNLVDLSKDPWPNKRARISVKKKDEFFPSEIPETSTKDLKDKNCAKVFVQKKDEPVSCEISADETKTNVIPNSDKKFFPIFTSSPKSRVREKNSLNSESKTEVADKTSQNHDDTFSIKISKINGTECNEHPVGKLNDVSGDIEKNSKIISGKNSDICSNETSVKHEEILKTDNITAELGNKNNLSQASFIKKEETPVTNGILSDFISTSSDCDKSKLLKKIRKKKNMKGKVGRPKKVNNECQTLDVVDVNTTPGSKSEKDKIELLKKKKGRVGRPKKVNNECQTLNAVDPNTTIGSKSESNTIKLLKKKNVKGKVGRPKIVNDQSPTLNVVDPNTKVGSTLEDDNIKSLKKKKGKVGRPKKVKNECLTLNTVDLNTTVGLKSEGDKISSLKKNVKGKVGRPKRVNERQTLIKADSNTIVESKSDINNEADVTKPAGALKLFPIFSSFHSLTKISSPEAKEKNKLLIDIMGGVQQTEPPSSEILGSVQTEQLSCNTCHVEVEKPLNVITDFVQTKQVSDIADDIQAKQQLVDISNDLQSDDATDCVQTEQLSDNIADYVTQTEELSNGMKSEQPSDNVACIMQTEQLSNDSVDCVQTKQSSIIKDNVLATTCEPSSEIIFDESLKEVDHNSVSVIKPVRARKKRKLNKPEDSVTVSSLRVTRSQIIKSASNTNHNETSLSNAESDSVAATKCDSLKRKLRQNETKLDALKPLPQGGQCSKKKKDNTDLQKVNPTKLFPLFSKSQINGTVKKNISQSDISAEKKKNNAKTPDRSRTSVECDSEDDISEERMQSKKKHKVKNKSKVLKKKNSNVETLEGSDDSVVEVSGIDNFKVETKITKQLESMNKTEILAEKNTVTMPRKKGCNVSSKTLEMHLTFPCITQCYTLEKEFNSSLTKFPLKEEDLSPEITIPLWDKIVGLTNIKSIGEGDIVSSPQSIANTAQIMHGNEISDSLWTDISNDYNLKEGVSESTISDLNLWLSQWKSRFSKKEKSKHIDSDDSFDSFSSDSNDSEAEGLSNSIIIMGPPGCGKTSLVFSLANDHGFKVLEVNASSSRNGRNISHQLKEALESYHVENIKTTGLNFQKEPFKEDSEDIPLKKPKNKGAAKKGIADFLQKGKKSETVNKKATMVSFFQVKPSSKGSVENQKLKKIDIKHQSTTVCSNNSTVASASRSISTRTIILFDDIDVVFQEDEGLWSTIRNFLKISKKPVIFTISRNLAVVKANLDSDIRVLYLKPMIEEVAVEKINSQYKAYSRENSNVNMKLLLNNSNDVRKNLLHAQFWSQPCDLDSSTEPNQVFSTNTFLLGSLNFNAVDFIPLIFKKKFPNSYPMISEYHKIGYDLLHSNLFTILNGTDVSTTIKSWQSVTKRTNKNECGSLEDLDVEQEHANGMGESDLWKEACKIFELKKQRLLKGSPSDDLFIFSDVLDNFSFTDSLKGCSFKNNKWISQPDRNQMWNSGLPACSEESAICTDDFILDMVSLVQMLGLQLAQNKHSSKLDFKRNDNRMLVLEHPFLNGNEADVNAQLESIASEFPPSHILNKTAFNLDYLSTLKIMCHEELLRQTKSGKRSNRFLHYFDSISLYIDKSQIERCVE